MIMKKILIVLALASLCAGASAQEFSWSRAKMDGSRTGVTSAGADRVDEALGKMKGKKYVAPNGRKFSKGVTPSVASLLLGAQKEMASVKEVVGYAPRAMVRSTPECELSDWFVDELMRAASEKTGRRVDFGITNFGGIRVDMPQGDVLLDDIMSMFPFKNNLCYLELRGSDIRALLEQLAATSWQCVGGARCTVKDGKLVSAEIGGEPIDDDRVYGVATISFLLDGGDGISVARNALRLDILDEYIIDVMLPYVKKLTAEGKYIEYQTDGRIKFL
jgi:2',3'-cyclic-nucleotide 2'-phosphodiesterase (5'-nucleotidase family)